MSLRSASLVVVLFLATSVCPARVELRDDPPPVPPARAGDVRGTIAPAAKVARIAAVCRPTQKVYPPSSFDRKTGRFRFRALPGDAEYDLRISTTDGRTIEGIDLSWVEARMLRLAKARRKQLDLPPERTRKFTAADAKALLKWVEQWQDFLEVKRVLYLHGHGKQATLLVELMRTRPFYASGGDWVWRVELWYFRYEFGGWDIVPNVDRMLHRRRVKPPEFGKIHLQYFPELSVHVGRDGTSKPVHFTLPDKPDPSRGRVPGTAPDIKTKPHLLGLDDKPPGAERGGK